MTATDILRRLLDERGVEWGDDGYPTTCTVWASDGIVWHGLWRDDCIELIAHLTPEQAIAATLGAGTCHIEPWKMEHDTGFFDCMECSECGYVTDVSEWAKATYCAGCGRRIEQ